ncbi:uncharacterized protein LOC114533461 [Dendronephthya gigantea]|uniref:uncharacterized protein LOC114533461 n=1 Tax=Dendronephthya gigantea TaxID=151771 RepID=UPI00106C76D9|nr:uncharacterized protein LOC114533461 [Dendronephthya gigantea]
MSSYFGLAVLCLVSIIEVRLEAAFVVTRGQTDKFTNDNPSSVSECAEYYARCQSASCEVCVCDKEIPTYVASEKRCMKDHEISPQSVPKYSSFSISSEFGQSYIAAEKISNKLDRETEYTGNQNQLWLYTSSKKLLNLKTLKCLDSRNLKRLALQPCSVNQTENQMWYCNRNSRMVYRVNNGVKLYLEFSGHFQTRFYDDSTKWVADKGTSAQRRSVCALPVKYRGCYRFTSGSLVKRLSAKPQLNPDKFEEMKISAPIFRQEKAKNPTCVLLWNNTVFSVNDQPWTSVSAYENNFDNKGVTEPLGEVVFRFNEKAKTIWAGALMKLMVRCIYEENANGETYEEHCILLKFDGVFNQSSRKVGTSWPPSLSKSSSSDSSYKASTIGLSVVLGFLLIAIAIAAVVSYKRRSSNTNDYTKPICDAEDL